MESIMGGGHDMTSAGLDAKGILAMASAAQCPASMGGGGKDIHVEAVRPVERRDYSLAELSSYDGSVPGVAILVCLDGKIFDVSPKADLYGIGGPYSWLAGKDGSIQLATMKKEGAGITSVEELDDKQRKILADWVAVYEKKYEFVGMLDKKQDMFI